MARARGRLLATQAGGAGMADVIGSLFAGVGGLELGLERAGLGPVAWQVEIDPWCRKVLAKHWPDAERFEDVKTIGRSTLASVDVICGGFPCQDVSVAGLGAGLREGTRSGLWIEFARIVGELLPRFVVVENVASGKRRWLPRVRRDLSLLGYRTRAVAVSAFNVGAPHRRARVFVLATHTHGEQLRHEPGRSGREDRRRASVCSEARTARPASDSDGMRQLQPQGSIAQFWRWSRNGNGWQIEPPIRGVDDGPAGRVDRGRRLKALGNAVVPQCAEAVGRMLDVHRQGARGSPIGRYVLADLECHACGKLRAELAAAADGTGLCAACWAEICMGGNTAADTIERGEHLK